MKNFWKTIKQTSLILAGSLSGLALINSQDYIEQHVAQSVLVIITLTFVGAGGLDQAGLMINKAIRSINKHFKSIAVVLPFDIIEGETSSWQSLNSENYLNAVAASGFKIRKIKSTKQICRYPVVINSYGGCYPEENFEELASFHIILNYVSGGGVFVNLGDIPFYYAYSKIHQRFINTTPFAGGLHFERSFLHSLVTNKLAVLTLGIGVTNGNILVERVFIKEPAMINLFSDWLPVNVNGEIKEASPCVAIPYGKGYFVFSTLPVNKKSTNHVKTMVKKAYCLKCNLK